MKRITILVLSIALVLVGNAWAETLFVAGGATDQSVPITIVDSTTGLAETGVTSATGGLALWYWRQGGTQTAITESDLAALDSAHSDGGMFECGDGAYRLDVEDDAFAAGAAWVKIGGTVTGMVVYGPTIMISAPIGAAASVTGAVGSVTGAVGSVTGSVGSVTGAVGSVTGAVGSVTAGVTLANGAHGGAAASLTLADYSAFKATGFSTHSAADVVNEWETQSQADPTGFHVNVLEVNGTAQTASDIGADTAAILLDTDELQAELADGGRTDLLIDGIKTSTDRITAARATIIDDWGEDGRLDTIVDSILSDTGEVQTELADGGRTDLLIDSILEDTAELVENIGGYGGIMGPR